MSYSFIVISVLDLFMLLDSRYSLTAGIARLSGMDGYIASKSIVKKLNRGGYSGY